MITQGDKDDVVPESEVSKFASRLGNQAKYHMIEGADHYYRGHEEELSGVMDEYLAERMDNFTQRRRVRPERKRRQPPKAVGEAE